MKNAIKLISLLAVITLFAGCGDKPEDMFKAGIKNYNEQKYLFAIEFFEKTLKIEPENIKAKFYLGMCYKRTDQISKALETIKECYEINPKDFYISFNIADCYFLQKNYDETLSWARKSLQIKPDFIESHFLIANAMLKKGQTAQAQDELEFILKISDKNKPFIKNQSLFLLSTIYRKQGKLNNSLENLKKITKNMPKNQEYLYNLGLTYNAMDNKTETSNIINKLKAMNSGKAQELKKIISKK